MIAEARAFGREVGCCLATPVNPCDPTGFMLLTNRLFLWGGGDGAPNGDTPVVIPVIPAIPDIPDIPAIPCIPEIFEYPAGAVLDLPNYG